jgi:DNA-binding transcriptional LysR family regulator
MDIHQLKVFASVFQEKSFSKASRKLHLTQPTISAHIKALEEEYKCKLFDRLGRTTIPTKEAEVLYRHAVEIIEKSELIKEAIGKCKEEISGRVIIGASTIPGTYLLPSMIKPFQEKYPYVSIQVIISDSKKVIEDISQYELLIGIVGAKLDNELIDYVPFIEDELIVVSSRSLIKENKMSLKTLIKFPVVLREEGSGTRRETEKILGNRGITIKGLDVTGIFGSTDAIKQAVKAGLGISILSKFSVKDEIENNILKEIKITDVQMRRKFYIVIHKKRTLPLSYAIFLKHLLSESKHI